GLSERGLFDAHLRMDQISTMGDPLAALEAVMDWSIFAPVFDSMEHVEAKGPGGRPAYAPLFMFKVLVIQSLYGLSDEQTQYQILDRRSFHRFLGLIDADRVPDQNTIRLFREKLTAEGLFEKLFGAFHQRLLEKGFITRKGQIIDASFVEVPRQRNTRAENESIKNGEMPEGWEEDPKRLSHKDLDARWTKKNNVSYYGYKDHVAMDLESKLIVRSEVTDASVHDSQMLDALTRPGDPVTWVDSGYAGAPCEAIFASKNIEAKICEKGARSHPLTEGQKQANRAKSRKRSRVEHIFAFMTGSMCAMYRRCVGLARNRGSILLGNLVYNMARVEQIVRLGLLGRRKPVLA
ncbi:MAG TPA: IS5 family transposase, partial [Chthoniobacterales bacterium]